MGHGADERLPLLRLDGGHALIGPRVGFDQLVPKLPPVRSRHPTMSTGIGRVRGGGGAAVLHGTVRLKTTRDTRGVFGADDDYLE